MKKLLFPLLAMLVAFGFDSCQKDEPSGSDKHITGIWAFTRDDDTTHSCFQYVDMHDDGSFELFYSYMGDTKYYECYKGKYTFQNDQLLFTATDYKIYFYYNNVLRLGPVLLHQNLVQNWNILNISDDKISAKSSENCTLTRLSAKPDDWKQEFFLPEKNPTDEEMVATWDLLNTWNINDRGFNWYAYNYPQYEGMQLTKEHEISYAFFWVEWLSKKLKNDGAIEQNKGLSISSQYSKWALVKDELTLTTSQYEVVTYDDAGNETDRKEVIPPSPIGASFNVVYFTDLFLVLYCPEDNTNYVFTPGKPLSSAPANVATSPRLTKHRNLSEPLSDHAEGTSFFTDFAK
jgi:hypothetical protein